MAILYLWGREAFLYLWGRESILYLWGRESPLFRQFLDPFIAAEPQEDRQSLEDLV